MSHKYKIRDHWKPYFVTITVVQWVDLFTRDEYRQVIIDSLAYCIAQKGLILHAWVIMPNHLHLIVSSQNNYYLPNIIRDFKKFTSVSLARTLVANPHESRREWLLQIFGEHAAGSNKHQKFQIWQEGYHPIELSDAQRTEQRLKYLHENPVRAGWVWQPEAYAYSSAAAYYTNLPDDRLTLAFL